MKEDKNKEELQSRREFFKSAAKAALPIVGAVVLANVPSAMKGQSGGSTYFKTIPSSINGGNFGCNGCSGNCTGTCSGGCYSSCSGGCEGGCSGNCSGNCSNQCSGCGNGCANTCSGWSSYN